MVSWGFGNSQFGLSALRLRIGYVSNGKVGPPIWPYDPGRIGLFSGPPVSRPCYVLDLSWTDTACASTTLTCASTDVCPRRAHTNEKGD
jgi:hypothetical protein